MSETMISLYFFILLCKWCPTPIYKLIRNKSAMKRIIQQPFIPVPPTAASFVNQNGVKKRHLLKGQPLHLANSAKAVGCFLRICLAMAQSSFTVSSGNRKTGQVPIRRLRKKRIQRRYKPMIRIIPLSIIIGVLAWQLRPRRPQTRLAGGRC